MGVNVICESSSTNYWASRAVEQSGGPVPPIRRGSTCFALWPCISKDEKLGCRAAGRTNCFKSSSALQGLPEID